MGNTCFKSKTEQTGETRTRKSKHEVARESDDQGVPVSEAGVKVSVPSPEEPTGAETDPPPKMFPAISWQGLYAVAMVTPDVVMTGAEDGAISATQISDAGRLAHMPAAHGGDVRHFYMCSKQGPMLSCSRDRTVKVWNLDDAGVPSHVHTLSGHSLVVANVCANHDMTRAVSGSRDNTVRLWDLGSGTQLHCDRTARNLVHCLRFVNEHTVIQGGENLKLYVWDVRGDKICLDEAKPNPITGVGEQPVCMAASPDGMSVVVGYKGFDVTAAVLRVWDVRQRRQMQLYQGHANCVTDVAYMGVDGDGGGRRLVSAAHDRSVRVWDELTGSCISSASLPSSVDAPTDLSLHPDKPHRFCLGSSSGALCVFEWDSRARQLHLERQFGPA
eukprot:Hpha_TRINITY_DN34718_c0_g1::TRINITY_DN34718_c0_g1_i1::g.177945::m.177945